MKTVFPARPGVCALAALAVAASAAAAGFEVTKNVNTGRPPVERVVLFDRERPADHLVFSGRDAGALARATNGAIVATIAGGGGFAARIGWKPGEGRPASFAPADYTYLILTCRLEGQVNEPNPRGQMIGKRPGNVWFSAFLYNATGERVGAVSLADVNAANEGVTPAETVALRIPLAMFQGTTPADRRVAMIGTEWGPTRPPQVRDFRWVIDRIALAD